MNVVKILTLTLLLIIYSAFAQSQRAFSSDVLQQPQEHKEVFNTLLPIKEILVFNRVASPSSVLLENGYAQHRFKNADEWPLQGQHVVATEVTVIFTKYPKDSAFWLTDYQWLLAKRLESLFALDSNLNSTSIKYSILLQTDCDNEFETMQLFHGIRIGYKPLNENAQKQPSAKDDQAETNKVTTAASERNKASIRKINQLMYQERYSMDSAVFNVLQRNDWENSVLVLDWTGSMYGYGAEALLWQAINEDSSNIERCAFFNDGDRTKDRKKMLGYTGGVYISDVDPIAGPVRAMRKIQRRGKGGDSPENDIEALFTSIQKSSKTREIILVADNNSCIRDFVLLGCLNRPVHVILCGTKNGINHQYLNLAWRTGGSIHTKYLDLDSIDAKLKNDSLIVEGVRYTVTMNNLIMPMQRSENFFSYCDRYYQPPRKKQKTKRRKEPKCYFTK